MEKQYFLSVNKEELAAVLFGLELLHRHLADDQRKTMGDLKTVVNLHQRIRPELDAGTPGQVDPDSGREFPGS